MAPDNGHPYRQGEVAADLAQTIAGLHLELAIERSRAAVAHEQLVAMTAERDRAVEAVQALEVDRQ